MNASSGSVVPSHTKRASRTSRMAASSPTIEHVLRRVCDLDLRAEMDMVCGLTACSAEGSNNGTFKPIDFLIFDGPD